MTQSIIGCGTNSNLSITVANPTTSVIIGSGSVSLTGDHTESNAQTIWRQPGVFSNLTTKVAAAPDADSTFSYRVGGVNGNQIITLPAATSGTFTDITHTDSVSSGDVINGRFVNASSTTTMIIRGLMYALFSPTTSANTVNKLTCSDLAIITSVGTKYQSLGGIGAGSSASNASTEANTQFKNKTAATLQNLYLYISVNAYAPPTPSSFKSRVNGADGNLAISITASSAGAFEDTTHSDSVTSGDLINTAFNVSGSGTGGISINIMSVDYVNSALTKVPFVTGGYYIASDSNKRYAPLCGASGLASGLTASSSVSVKAGSNVAISNLECFAISNSSAGDFTVKVFKNDVAGNEVVTYATTVTGYLEDSTNSDLFIPTDKISLEFSDTPSGSVLLGNYGVWLSASSPEEVTVDKWAHEYQDIIYKVKSIFPIGLSSYPFDIAIGESIFADKWIPSYPDFARKTKPLIPEGDSVYPFGIFTGEVILPDKWMPSYPDFSRKKKQLVSEGDSFYPFGIITKEIVFPDKWNPYYPDFFRKQKPDVPEGYSYYPFGVISKEIIYPDKWTPSYPDFFRKPKPDVPEGKTVYPFGVVTKEVIFLDKWAPSYPDFIRKSKSASPEWRGIWPISISGSMQVYVDRWHPILPLYMRKPVSPYIGLQFIMNPSVSASSQIIYVSEDDIFNFFYT